jgi:hypothetical protein
MNQVNRKTGTILKRYTQRYEVLSEQLEDKGFLRESKNVARAALLLERAATSYERKADRLAKLRVLTNARAAEKVAEQPPVQKATVVKIKKRRTTTRQAQARH